MEFESIISDSVKATATDFSWSDLGFKYAGTTQALVFDAEIEKNRNTYMAEQYQKGRVKQHSVGMRYVKYVLAMDSDSPADREEKKMWDKYYPQIANKETADEQGYFFAVLEAKVIEGSAVVLGSNYATPTISVEGLEAGKTTSGVEPEITTQQETTKDETTEFLTNLLKTIKNN